MAHGFVTFTFWQSSNFVDFFFFFFTDLGFFREIHLWLLKSDKHVNCISVNNIYQKNFVLNFKETYVVPLVSSIYLIAIR